MAAKSHDHLDLMTKVEVRRCHLIIEKYSEMLRKCTDSSNPGSEKVKLSLYKAPVTLIYDEPRVDKTSTITPDFSIGTNCGGFTLIEMPVTPIRRRL